MTVDPFPVSASTAPTNIIVERSGTTYYLSWRPGLDEVKTFVHRCYTIPLQLQQPVDANSSLPSEAAEPLNCVVSVFLCVFVGVVSVFLCGFVSVGVVSVFLCGFVGVVSVFLCVFVSVGVVSVFLCGFVSVGVVSVFLCVFVSVGAVSVFLCVFVSVGVVSIFLCGLCQWGW